MFKALRKFKLIAAVFLVVALFMTIVACGSDEPTAPAEPAADPTAKPVTEKKRRRRRQFPQQKNPLSPSPKLAH